MGEPERWPIVIGAARSPEWEEHNTNMVGFLTELLGRNRKSSIIPVQFPPNEPISFVQKG
jgi:hypothetical protein